MVGFSSIPYLGIHGFNVSGSTAFPVYFTSTNPTFATDACAPLPPSTPNLAGYVVVVQGGGCTLLVKSTSRRPLFVAVSSNSNSDHRHRKFRRSALHRVWPVYNRHWSRGGEPRFHCGRQHAFVGWAHGECRHPDERDASSTQSHSS